MEAPWSAEGVLALTGALGKPGTDAIDLKKKILGSLVTKTLNLQGVVNSLTQNLFLKSYM
jgi:hypothetical protein